VGIGSLAENYSRV